MHLSDATILVVDDEPILREGYATWLKRRGCKKVWTAANGLEAFEIYATESIDVIVSDVRMPVMDGVSLPHKISESGKGIPIVIFVSGFSNFELSVAYSLGMQNFLAKPFSGPVLIDAVTRSLAAREELWNTPMKDKPQNEIAIDALADANRDLRFGRGGFSFRLQETASLAPLSFMIHVPDATSPIMGEGNIRWTSKESQRIGVEFHYLAPESRPLALAWVDARSSNSFIPL